MSKHKLYDLEVTPPPGVWDKIAAELDESELSHQFPVALYNMQVAPPLNAWQQIAASLDESALVNDYAAKLTTAAVVPPMTTWDKIRASLDEEATPVIPQQHRVRGWVRYAAAAAILGFLAWGGIRFFSEKTSVKKTDFATNPATQPVQHTESQPIASINGNIVVDDVEAALQEARNDEALEASKKTFAKIDVDAVVRKSKVKNAADFVFVSDDYSNTVSTRSVDIFYTPPEKIAIPEISNRYIVLVTQEGNIIRMSKKLRDQACCVSGEEVDQACEDLMKKWREKIASPAVTHSPGNFLDILSMVNSLKDN